MIAVCAEGLFIHRRHVHILAAGASVDVGIDVIIIIYIVAIKWRHVLDLRWWRLRCRRLAYRASSRRSLR